MALGAAAAALVAAALGTALVLQWARAELHRPFKGWSGEAASIELEPGLDAQSILERLGKAGVLERPGLALAWLRLRGGSQTLQAGEYRFDQPLSAIEVLERLAHGDILLHPVTIPEGLTLTEIADKLAGDGLGQRDALLAAFRDPAPIRDLDPAAVDLEGYLFPDTYRFSRNASPSQIVATLTQRFRVVTGPTYPLRAAAVGLDLRRAVILASMIEKETSIWAERGRISRVFHNRLGRKMRLECDPTVRYALERAGHPAARLTLHDLQFESPWNTYRVSGLPVGPIGNPGRASLEAAVGPVSGDELFFVAAPGGGHRFSRDLPAHLRAVDAWRAYLASSR